MESGPNAVSAVRPSMPRSESGSRVISIDTPVANIRFTGVIANEDSSDSDEDLHHNLDRRSADDVIESSRQPSEIQITDDYFAPPEGHFQVSTIAALESAIESCKRLVLQAVPHADRTKDLVRKLVALRLQLLEAKDGSQLASLNAKLVMGHMLDELPWGSAKGYYCERCNGMIIGMVQTWLRCTVCGFCCHKSCLNHITRTCASIKVAASPEFVRAICPEKGLHVQKYRCSECRAVIGYQPGMREPRLCDYTGMFYCDQCHWNDVMVIPARVLANWDFEPRKLCRASKQFLRLMMRRPVIRIQDVNPMLFSYLQELNDVKRLREELLIMKQYFLQCPDALASKLLCQLADRQHFVENSDMYSLQDIVDLASDILLPQLTKIHASFALHVRTDCKVCQAKGSLCRLCRDEQVLFPFDNDAFICPRCATIYHRHCYLTQKQKCPVCLERRVDQSHAS